MATEENQNERKRPWLVDVLVRLGVPVSLAAAVAAAIALLVVGCAGYEVAAVADGVVVKRSGSSSQTSVSQTPVLPSILPPASSADPPPQK